MSNHTWRTIIIDNHVDLSYSMGNLVVSYDDGNVQNIPLFDVRTIVIHSLQIKLTTYLLNELHKRHINVIFCSENKRPYGEIVGYYDYHATPARLYKQILWKKEVRRNVWVQIVRQKISVQLALLKLLNLSTDDEKWEKYSDNIVGEDQTNREGQAARLYFNAVFGLKFHRREDSPINDALNYGYAILCSTVTLALTAHGYHPSLGIAHRGGTNPYNFSYDLLEPFRPFIDRIVYQNQSKILDRDYKKQLIDVTNTIIRYKNKRMPLVSAVDHYVLGITKFLTKEAGQIGEIRFEE